jgi:hypothetical protein
LKRKVESLVAKQERTESLEGGTARRLAWADGDFYMPGFASDGRSGLVPGRPDLQRRLFLKRAAMLEPRVLATLRKVRADDELGLSNWAERWQLTDPWCLALARDTIRWYARDPKAQGWRFEGKGLFVGNFPFKITPLRFGPFYYDPTSRRPAEFKQYVCERVNEGLDYYCKQIEETARTLGLKRAPRRREPEHFDWLVRYQVKAESFASIAQNSSYKFQGGRQTVRKAAVALAEDLALTLRPST